MLVWAAISCSKKDSREILVEASKREILPIDAKRVLPKKVHRIIDIVGTL